MVAGEIKSLADTASENTKKISVIITLIQKETAKAVAAMATGFERTGEGVALIAEVEKTLLSVQETAERSSGATRLIARSTAEQLSGAKQIATSAEIMTQMSREIAAASKEQAQGTTAVVQQLRGLVTLLGEQATLLKSDLERISVKRRMQ